MDILILALPASAFLLALVKPQWGVILVISSLPVESMVPQSLFGAIPFFTSPVSALGGVVFVGAVLNLIVTRRLHFSRIFSSGVQLMGLLFIAWFTITHPVDSWFGYGRNYVFTFVQLWSLLWLAATVLEDEEHQTLLMMLFVGVSLLSAVDSLTGGQVASSRDESIRSAGMMSGLNTAARYFVIGMIFAFYIRARAKTKRSRALALGAAIFLLVSVVYTQSRAGIALALSALLMLFVVSPGTGRSRNVASLAGLLMVVALVLPSALWESIGSSFYTEESRPRERYQSVDENIRYSLWYAGFQMWADNPIVGIGMGRFQLELSNYLPGLIPGKFGALSTHNMFVKVLAETGIVGFGLFIAIIWAALRGLRRARPPEISSKLHISDVWFAALLVIVLGGLLKDDHADKLFWLFLGIASSYRDNPPSSRDVADNLRPVPLQK